MLIALFTCLAWISASSESTNHYLSHNDAMKQQVWGVNPQESSTSVSIIIELASAIVMSSIVELLSSGRLSEMMGVLATG